jgi:hypothetical protein
METTTYSGYKLAKQKIIAFFSNYCSITNVSKILCHPGFYASTNFL